MSVIIISLTIAIMLTGCGKNKKEDNTTPVVETPVVETPVVQEPAETGIGDVVVLKDSNIPYIIVGKNFVDPTTKQESEYVAIFYTKGISAENNKVYGFSKDKISFTLTEIDKGRLSEMGLNTEPTDDDVVHAKIHTLEMDPLKKAELMRNATQYSVYTKTETENGISIAIMNIDFSSQENEDRFIFDLSFENKGAEEIIANGRLDIILTNGSTVYECDDSLIDAQDIINFRLKPGTKRTGRIAFEVPKGVGKNLIFKYKSDKVEELTWYLYEKVFTEEMGD